MTGPEADARRIRRRTVGKGPVIGSAIVHTAAIFLAWWTSAVPPQAPEFITFEIELISPPAAELGELTPPPPQELVIETPLERVPEPQEEPPPTLVEADAPAEELPPPEELPEPTQTVSTPDVELVGTEPATSPNPDPDVETPGEDLNVRMEGLRRDYPEYYNNIVRQMRRCFRWRGQEDLRATVYFVINRDGTVSEVDVLESSRNIAFDIEVMGAAECAGSRNRLGPLPEELPFDRLQVRFEIDPQAGRRFDFEE